MRQIAPAIPDHLLAALQRELYPGERVEWQAQPLRRLDAPLFVTWLVGVPFTAFSAFWIAMSVSGARAGEGAVGLGIWAFPAMGLPFVAIGALLLALPFMPLLTAGRTLFAITDRRLVRVSVTVRKLAAKSVEIRAVTELSRVENSVGEGKLIAVYGQPVLARNAVRRQEFRIGQVAQVFEAERALRRRIDALSCVSSSPI